MTAHLNAKLNLIFGRRSIRVFRRQSVGDELVQKILEAAMAAPSAMARDPWRFVVARQPETLARIAAALPHGGMIASAAVGIIVCGDLKAAHDGQLSYLLQDCSAAMENLLLAAHGLGLGACWLGIHPREDRILRIGQIVSLPEHVLPVCGVALGYPGEEKPARTRFNPSYVHQEQW